MTQPEKISRSRNCKHTRSIATRQLTLDQWVRFLVHQDSATDPLESQDAWGTGRNDQTPRGFYMR